MPISKTALSKGHGKLTCHKTVEYRFLLSGKYAEIAVVLTLCFVTKQSIRNFFSSDLGCGKMNMAVIGRRDGSVVREEVEI